jgi:hypothetical protein
VIYSISSCIHHKIIYGNRLRTTEYLGEEPALMTFLTACAKRDTIEETGRSTIVALGVRMSDHGLRPGRYLFISKGGFMKEHSRIGRFATAWGRRVLTAAALVGFMAVSAPAADVKPVEADKKPVVDTHADKLLRRMGDYLGQAQFFSVNAEVWQDLQLASGQRIQAGRTIELQVRRPNRLHAEVRSTRRNRGLYYDGKSITLLNRTQNLYGSIPAPGTLDEALDEACERFGITMPL